MDIEKLKAEFQKLKYVEDKLEYLNFDEHLGCYVEKSNGMPVGLAAWVNGAFYGFEEAAKAQAVPEGFVLVPKNELQEVLSNASDAMGDEKNSHVYLTTGEPSTWFDHFTVAENAVLKAIEVQEQSNG